MELTDIEILTITEELRKTCNENIKQKEINFQQSRSSIASLFTIEIQVSWEKISWNILRRGNKRFPSITVAKQQKRTLLIDRCW